MRRYERYLLVERRLKSRRIIVRWARGRSRWRFWWRRLFVCRRCYSRWRRPCFESSRIIVDRTGSCTSCTGCWYWCFAARRTSHRWWCRRISSRCRRRSCPWQQLCRRWWRRLSNVRHHKTNLGCKWCHLWQSWMLNCFGRFFRDQACSEGKCTPLGNAFRSRRRSGPVEGTMRSLPGKFLLILLRLIVLHCFSDKAFPLGHAFQVHLSDLMHALLKGSVVMKQFLHTSFLLVFVEHRATSEVRRSTH